MRPEIWSVLALSMLAGPGTSRAEDVRFSDLLTDAKLYFTAPIRWDSSNWLEFGGVLAAIAADHQADAHVRDHFAPPGSFVLNGRDNNALHDALPGAALFMGTAVFGFLSSDSAGRDETYTMFEATLFSSITTEVVRYGAGRARPDQTLRVDDWRSGGSSFPSLHSSAAFAIGTVLAESGSDEFRWVRRILGYGVGAGTAFLRMRHNVHWLSDTVAGSAIGFSSAQFSMNRREERAHRLEVSVSPAQGGGVSVGFNLTLQ